MANPEGTQQLRDRDLEFMFYDEAQVGVYCFSCRAVVDEDPFTIRLLLRLQLKNSVAVTAAGFSNRLQPRRWRAVTGQPATVSLIIM